MKSREFRLTYIGHAGWLIEGPEFKAAFDPWFNPEGTFMNSWHQFPDNSHLCAEDLLSGLDFLYISHSHCDHFDPWTLEKVDKDTCIVIPRFRDKVLRDGLRDLGFVNILELREGELYKTSGVHVQVIIEEGYNDRDSAIVLESEGFKVLNLNDCHPSYEKVSKYSKNTDLLLMQCSSAIWWPCVYDYSEEEMLKRCRDKKRNVLRRAKQYASCIKPKYVVPNAGPPLFLHEEFAFWDETRQEDYNPFPLHDEICNHLKESGHPSMLVIPGSVVSVVDGEVENNTNLKLRDEIYSDFKNYLSVMREKKRKRGHLNFDSLQEQDTSFLVENFSSLVREIRKQSRVFIHKINFPVLIEFIDHSKWVIDFSLDPEHCFSPYGSQDYAYRFTFDPRIVSRLIKRKYIDFDEYFLSMRFSCHREKDVFNEFLFSMFKNFDIKRFKLSENIFMTNDIASERQADTFMLDVGGRVKKVQKYCPHRFVNLEECGIVKGNTITCPLHNWTFDLDSGECMTASEYCLTIEDV